ncbi:cilia- and flagella-associated protein 74 [Lampris incognitus]|uniref:cilia- and flagella-associated protein 74 n=1 Tax=Lampris incognitus TaxID=2546036 RepID=UPI0024B50EDB|nr:cilia- and flagella-associated protein 74 [Lampris incognitus]
MGSYAETARMFKLRRSLNQLDFFHRQKEHDVLKAREKLKVCCQNIADIENQRDKVEEEIKQQKNADNSAMVFCMQAQHKRLCQELLREEELMAHINTTLNQQEQELYRVEVELGKVSLLRQEVVKKEGVFQALKTQRATAQLHRKNNATHNQQCKIKHLKDKVAINKRGNIQSQSTIQEAQECHKTAAKYLKETIKRMRQQEAEKEQQSREIMQKRIQAVKSLKTSIAATQENIRVQQSKAKANSQKKEQEERRLRESLQAQGINSIKSAYQQKQLEEFQLKKQEYEERQKSKRVEIVAKILGEEQFARRNKKRLALLSHPIPMNKALQYLDPKPPPAKSSQAKEERATRKDLSDSSSSSSDDASTEDLQESLYQQGEQWIDEDLVAPEFGGLWDETYKKGLNVETVDKLQEKEAKQEVPQKPAEKLTMPAKNIVCRKEMKGPPFISKPEVIHFKDFEVGKTYKRKVILTNVSYTTNYCKLLGVSTQLMDFLSISFKPPGSLSAGMSCDVQAVFQPTINKDLEGEVQFISATGPFSVLIRCTIKKCDLEVDSHLIDFGTHVVDQTVSRTITLTNRGALGTMFSLDISTCPENSQGQMPSQSSTSMQQETSNQDMSFHTSPNQKSSSLRSIQDVGSNQEDQELSMDSQQKESATLEASSPRPESAISAGGNEVDVFLEQTEALIDQICSDTSNFTFGEERGEIGPFDSIKLEIMFTPTIPGVAKLDFHIKFSDSTCKPIPIKVRGLAIDVPLWVVQPSIDLKICMFDHLYQDSIIVQSRANTALRLTFVVCPEMQNHIKILPKTGFIKAKSSFHAQLKFLPSCMLSEDAKRFFDRDTGVLEVPMTVQVADQMRPVPFTVHAVVTSSDLQFDCNEVDFGYCSIYQSVKTSVRLTNLSLLPQDFGFIGLPEFIEVQPNDGFGTLLPLEFLEIDLIFSPKKAKDYLFRLNCKSGINRDFPLSCRGVGIHPPVQLSHSLIQFGATGVGGHAITVFYLIHSLTCRNQSSHAVTRVGREAEAPEGARLFSFTDPEDSGITIRPSAGRLLPGERCLVQVMFRPRLSEQEIREEAARLLHHTQFVRQEELERSGVELRQDTEHRTKTEMQGEPSKRKKVPPPQPQERQALNPNNQEGAASLGNEKLLTFTNPADIQPGSEAYEEGRASLLYSFTQRYSRYTIPCFVSDEDPPPEDRQAKPSWSPLNTLYLELHCPAVQPPLVVTSGNGQTTINFNQVAVGDKVVKNVTVQNISREFLDLSSSVLDLRGPFSLLNALRCIGPGERHMLLLAFTPTLSKKHCETLDVHSPNMTVELTLCGEGVDPAITCSPPGDLLDFGYVLERESASQVLQLQNGSSVRVRFRVSLASLCRPEKGADCLPLANISYPDTQIHPAVGTQNHSGLSVFSVTPMEGFIASKGSQAITITFQPDHQSVNYYDRFTVELMKKNIVCVMDLRGAACSRTMFLCGGDPLAVSTEALPPVLLPSDPELTKSETLEKPSMPVLLTLRAVYSKGAMRPAVRQLEVGCIHTMRPIKKNGEFHWDGLAALQQRGFTVEPSRGLVEAGQRCSITVTWTPPSGYKLNEVVQMCVPLTLNGDEPEIYRVTLLATVSIPVN